MNEAVLYEAEGGVARVTLNRPKSYNALNRDMVEGLAEAMTRAESDPAVRVVILRGAGDGFMAGGDIKMFKERVDLAPEERAAMTERLIHDVHPIVVTMRRMPKPIIASVNGACAGFGMSLLMACDLAVAAENAFFTLAYVHLGVSPDGGSTWLLPRHVGMKKAAEIAFFGDRFPAAEALRLGLVNQVVPAGELASRTEALAQRVLAGPAAALASTKKLLQRSITSPLEVQLQAEAEGFSGCTATADYVEGINAFLEKRPPKFGR
jgi:2-(1,2-epoxy-1,2-dihydrophenyl)acetyl-CoA isomerase